MLDIRFGGGSKFYFDEQSDCWAPTATVIACRGINTYKAGHKFALVLNTVREVERNLLLCATGRAALMRHRGRRRDRLMAMRLLNRLVNTGHDVVVSHVLSILGGPMERSVSPDVARRRRFSVSFVGLGRAQTHFAPLASVTRCVLVDAAFRILDRINERAGGGRQVACGNLAVPLLPEHSGPWSRGVPTTT